MEGVLPQLLYHDDVKVCCCGALEEGGHSAILFFAYIVL